MTFEKPMSSFIDTRINRSEHCRKPDCLMSLVQVPSDKCGPVVDVVNRNVYNRVCGPGYHCNVDKKCVRKLDTDDPNTISSYRYCSDLTGKDKNCISEVKNCKYVVVKNPALGHYENSIKICWGNVTKPAVLVKK